MSAPNSDSAAVYDESKIKTLSSLEHIRLRPGMYIGRLGNGSHPDDGIYILLKEVVDNAVDEFIMGVGKRINVEIDADGVVKVRDFGRGIPLGKLVECVSVINTGAKYNPDTMVPMKPGSFIIHHAGEIHYDGTKDDPAMIYIVGMGPAPSIDREEK